MLLPGLAVEMDETLITYDESRDTPETFTDNAAETRLRNEIYHGVLRRVSGPWTSNIMLLPGLAVETSETLIKYGESRSNTESI